MISNQKVVDVIIERRHILSASVEFSLLLGVLRESYIFLSKRYAPEQKVKHRIQNAFAMYMPYRHVKRIIHVVDRL